VAALLLLRLLLPPTRANQTGALLAPRAPLATAAIATVVLFWR
jgi:hypothetical protein